MIQMTLKQLSDILHGNAFGFNISFDTVVTDTRKIIPGCLFIALKGDNFDAHNFAAQAKNKHAGALLVNRKLDIDIPQVVVENTRLALGELAAWVRRQVSTRVVALTGTSGKTSVKEMTASILSQCGNTLCTDGNLNNDIGVPITLLRLSEEYKYAVIELSANHQGKIAWIADLVRPEAALVNNLAIAHLEGFGSLKSMVATKGEIYNSLTENGIAILNAASNDWLNWRTIIGKRRIWYFSLDSTNSDFTATDIKIMSHATNFKLQTPIGSVEIFLSLLGYHNIANALAASALAMAVGASLTDIKIGLTNFQAIPGRLFPILLNKNQLLIDDSYNANVGSVTSAIQVLSRMPGYRIMVVSDIAELGNQSEVCHIQVGKIVKFFCLDKVLSIGKYSAKLSNISGVGEHFCNKTSLIARLKVLLKQHSVVTVLVKGSRSSAMEDIVYALKEKTIC